MHAPKKPKGKELITAEKQENRRISGIRIKVEHAIGGMKKCRIVKERFRCHKFGFEDMVILIACGLHNFRITHKMVNTQFRAYPFYKASEWMPHKKLLLNSIVF